GREGEPVPDVDRARRRAEARQAVLDDHPEHAPERRRLCEVDRLEDHLPKPFLALRGEQHSLDEVPAVLSLARQQGGDDVAVHPADLVLAVGAGNERLEDGGALWAPTVDHGGEKRTEGG